MEKDMLVAPNQTLLSIKGQESISFDQEHQWVGGTSYFIQLYEGFLSSGLLTRLHGTAIKILLVLALRASRLGIRPYGTPEQIAQSGKFFQDLVDKRIVTLQDRGRLFCYIEHKDLAKLVGISDKTLTKYADQLHIYNLVERRSVRRGSYEYIIYFIEPAAYVDKYNTLHPRTEKGSIGDSTTEGSIVSPDQVTTNFIGKTATTATGTGLDEQIVLDYFADRKGVENYQPTAHDRVALQELRRAGISQAQVLTAIDQVFDAHAADAPPIRMFSYCANALLRQLDRPLLQDGSDQGAASRQQHTPATGETASTTMDTIMALYQAEIGPLSPAIERRLLALLQQHPHLQDWEYAFGETAVNNVRKLSYVESILDRLANAANHPPSTRSHTNEEKHRSPSPADQQSGRARSHRAQSSRSTRDVEALREHIQHVVPLDIAEILGTNDA